MRLELASVEQWNLGLSVSAAVASFALATPHFATSLAAGAFLEAINLGAIHRASQRLFAGEIMSGGWVGGLSMRLVLLGTAIYMTMQAGAHPIALLIGLSIAMPATLLDAWLNRPPIVDPATLPVFLDDGIDEDEAERLWLNGRLFTSRYSDREDADRIDVHGVDPEQNERAEIDSPSSATDPSASEADERRS